MMGINPSETKLNAMTQYHDTIACTDPAHLFLPCQSADPPACACFKEGALSQRNGHGERFTFQNANFMIATWIIEQILVHDVQFLLPGRLTIMIGLTTSVYFSSKG
ncbi:hypothetical protein ACTXT7_010604 [Hymenolepis weldensis]